MQHVGQERKQAGNYGQHNLRQLPVFEGWPPPVPQHAAAPGLEAMTSGNSFEDQQSEGIFQFEDLRINTTASDSDESPPTRRHPHLYSSILQDLAQCQFSCLKVTDTFSPTQPILLDYPYSWLCKQVNFHTAWGSNLRRLLPLYCLVLCLPTCSVW